MNRSLVRRATATCLATLALAALGDDAFAQQRIEETRSATAGMVIQIGTVSRDVRIMGWNREQVQITAVVDDEVERLDIRGDERQLYVTLEPRPDTRGHSRSSGDLEIRLPAGARVRAETVSGRISADDVAGAVDLYAMSGDIRISGAPNTVDAGTVSGSIDVNAPAQRIHATSTSGSIDIAGPAQQIRTSSTSGTIVVRQATGSVEAGTVSGQVQVNATAAVREVLLTSTSGGIAFRGALADDAFLEAESHSGSVLLDLPAAVNAAFNLNTVSGSISSDFDHPEPVNRRGPGRQLSFVAGTGTGRVSAQTFSGSLRLERH